QVYQSQNENKAVEGVMDGRRVVHDDEYVKILHDSDIKFTEENKPNDSFGKQVTKKWYFSYENENLKNGVELFYIMDSNQKSNTELLEDVAKYLGFVNIDFQQYPGCNEEIYTRISNSNVLPINFYINIKGNRVFIIKHYDQLKENKYLLNLNNFCLKN
ncbi:MAG: hypothetical protein ACRCXZ_02415, partial [Patescibacteria group bacterium]